MKKINIIAHDNGVGLKRDAEILYTVLTDAGFCVSRTGSKQPSFLKRLNFLRPEYDINIFIEHVRPKWFSRAKKNCIIPNPEWFREKWIKHLRKFDMILCKSSEAKKLFSNFNSNSEYISFTSLDRIQPNSEKNYNAFFHLAGKSKHKGTEQLINLWAKHSDWPKLTIVQHPSMVKNIPVTKNIDYIIDYVEDEKLKAMQNYNGIHLCPSESEGFGHYIVEAMSCKSLVLTTDAPPMNELVSPERGFLVNFDGKEKNKLGMKYRINVIDLEKKINQIIELNNEKKASIGKKSRAWFEHNEVFFKKGIVEIMQEL